MDTNQTNAAQPERDSGPGPMEILAAELTLRLASAAQQEQNLLQRAVELTENVQAGREPVHSLGRRLTALALDLERVVAERRLLEQLRAGGQL